MKETEQDFVERLLDEEHVAGADLRPATFEPVRTGLTKRQAIIKNLVNLSAEGDIAATKALLKLTGGRL